MAFPSYTQGLCQGLIGYLTRKINFLYDVHYIGGQSKKKGRLKSTSLKKINEYISYCHLINGRPLPKEEVKPGILPKNLVY